MHFQLISKTLTKKWFGHGSFDVRLQKKSSGGSMEKGGEAGEKERLEKLLLEKGIKLKDFDDKGFVIKLVEGIIKNLKTNFLQNQILLFL